MDIVDWIFPKYCVGCRTRGKYICDKCRAKVGLRGRSLRYEGVVQKLIKEIKYRGSHDMVEELVELWARATGPYPISSPGVVVTAVPMYLGKVKQRGYNQAELIARQLAYLWGVEYQELLVRTRQTLPMYGLDRRSRSKNVYGAFAKKQNTSIYPYVILVDDVWTTGATTNECAKVLCKHGTKHVSVVAIAR